MGYVVTPASAAEIAEQRQSYGALLAKLGEAASADEMDKILDERDVEEPGSDEEAMLIRRVQEKIKGQKQRKPKSKSG